MIVDLYLVRIVMRLQLAELIWAKIRPSGSYPAGSCDVAVGSFLLRTRIENVTYGIPLRLIDHSKLQSSCHRSMTKSVGLLQISGPKSSTCQQKSAIRCYGRCRSLSGHILSKVSKFLWLTILHRHLTCTSDGRVNRNGSAVCKMGMMHRDRDQLVIRTRLSIILDGPCTIETS